MLSYLLCYLNAWRNKITQRLRASAFILTKSLRVYYITILSYLLCYLNAWRNKITQRLRAFAFILTLCS
ncbi:hypothetical protein LX69_01571 [Breznakibacter xylanolyticus]|uniref:Uncharacterized protein n=1 Tax=Breznakibacter xylanolyticus TaxID=990 RepID=A0A2W7NVC3_9BACT|nr:hypothetical protein LX69_01571 [Breznakibacter xylanolyticus]